MKETVDIPFLLCLNIPKIFEQAKSKIVNTLGATL